MRPIEILQWGVFALGGVLWLVALWRRIAGRPLLLFAPRAQASWGLVDLVGAFVLMMVMQAVAAGAVAAAEAKDATTRLHELPPETLTAMMLATGGASLAATAIAMVVVRRRPGGSWRGLGVAPKLVGDLALGSAAFLMLAPIVYAVQALFVFLLDESQHALIEAMRQKHTPALLASAAFSVVLAAPVAEEFIFRVLLQGWLEKLFLSPKPDALLLLGGDEAPRVETAPARSVGAPAIFLSSLLFALMHSTHGPDPIALFVLAIGLGYLYRRTHRLLPCVVVHFWNNAFSFAMLVSTIK